MDLIRLPKWSAVETIVHQEGNTRHIYRQVLTFDKDKEMKFQAIDS